MIEKTITLDNVSLLDFLGVENRNINELAVAFPKSKIISRGNEIVVKGDSTDVVQISDILNSLVEHFHQFGRVTEENVRGYITQEKQDFVPEDSADGIL
ncbi:MAG: phosphate starvation-inducible protein PhoH, partial [Bacteroidota bacterium]